MAAASHKGQWRYLQTSVEVSVGPDTTQTFIRPLSPRLQNCSEAGVSWGAAQSSALNASQVLVDQV